MVSDQRYWQNWDRGQAAQLMDEYWLGAGETGWRKTLAADIELVFGGNASVLEVGCGSGLIYQELARRSIVSPASYVGGDISQKMLAIARQRFPEASFVDLDILGLDYPDQSQANVLCIQVIQHLPYYDQAMRELMRITAKKLYVSSWFVPGTEDKLEFTGPSIRWDGAALQNNVYSLSKFLTFIQSNSNRGFRDLRVHHFHGENYSVSLTLDH